MLFISWTCVMLFVSQLKRCASYDNLPFKTQCPVAFRSLLFVSTVDGKLTCIDAKNGQPLWIFDLNESLLSSSISHIKVGSVLRKSHFIPSLDGNLYKWNGQFVESIPLSSDYLLGQLKKLPDGSFVIGGYNVVVYGIDVATGKILYECSGNGCTPTQKGKIDENDIISLRKSQHTVRAVDRKTGHENWNYSVGKYEMELAEQDYISTFSNTDKIDLHFSVQNGVIYNKEESSVWSLKLKAPIADVWQLENRSLKSVDIFKYGLLEGEGLDSLPGGDQTFMFLGVHEGQLYIQKPLDIHRKRKHVLDRTPQLDVDLSHWRPFISTPSRTPTLNNNKQLTSLSILDYPFDNGFVLIANTTPTEMSILPDNSNPNDEDDAGVCDDNENGDNCDFKSVSEPPEKLEAVPLSPIDRWKEILILSVLLAVFINIGVKLLKRKFAAKTQLPVTSPETTLKPEEVQTKDETISEVKPKRTKTSSGTKSDSSTKVTIELSSSEAYISRYMEDFEHLECLGKGGFGVVFKATKRIDDIEYAIKRIYLPRCEEAKSKMMREVKALAALEHPGIVRYFHAWWEEPPQDWQLATDKTFLMKDYQHETSYALSQDWMLQVSVSGHSRNNSEKSKPEKRISDDPLGKRFNFITGIEDVITDHSEFDLFKHNDVFYPDDESSSFIAIDINKDFNEDSSDIEFDSDCTSDNINNTRGISRNKSLTLEESSVNKELNEDSFDIIFASNCSSDNPSESCHQTSSSNSPDNNRKKTLTQQDETDIFAKESDQINNSEVSNSEASPRRKRTRKRLVGKCCAQNSSCLTEPPLFLYIQMQLCKQETLKDWLKTKADEGIQLIESMQIFMQIVNAVEYFHNLGLMHRDLKPANIFFSMDGSVKVGDFGLVTAITRPSVGKHHHGKSFEDENHTGQVGTQLYMSPEQGTGKPYCHKVDIYSVGLIFFELVCAFSTQMERMKDIYRLKQGVLADDLLNTPQGKLVQILTATDPNMRPEAKEIKEHNFITEINNNMCDDRDKVANTVDSDLNGLTTVGS